MDNIEKLKEKVDKDPASKLFVPLAEEYKKAGMADKAIDVLKEGLQRQPGYMSARVSLGKIYLEKDMLSEAEEEFEQVIKAIPDNLFARRKLADIYRALGEKTKALEQYRTVLRLNPFDDEAIAFQRELESPEAVQPSPYQEPEAFSFEAPSEKDEVGLVEDIAEIQPSDDAFGGLVAEESAVMGPQEFPELTESFGAFNVEDIPPVEEEPVAVVEEAEAEVLAGEETLDFESLDALVAEISPEAELGEGIAELGEDVVELGESLAEPIESVAEFGAAEIGEDIAEFGGEMPEISAEFGISEESLSGEQPVDLEGIPLESAEAAFFEEEPLSVEELSGIDEADRLVAEGNYLDAMSGYRAALSADPENRQVMQRVVELKALLKMLGREGDLFEANLQSFLDGIKRRKDEFRGNA